MAPIKITCRVGKEGESISVTAPDGEKAFLDTPVGPVSAIMERKRLIFPYKEATVNLPTEEKPVYLWGGRRSIRKVYHTKDGKVVIKVEKIKEKKIISEVWPGRG